MCSFLGAIFGWIDHQITLRPADIADASTAMGETDSFFRSTTGHFRDTASAFRDTHNGFRDTGGTCKSEQVASWARQSLETEHGELVSKSAWSDMMSLGNNLYNT